MTKTALATPDPDRERGGTVVTTSGNSGSYGGGGGGGGRSVFVTMDSGVQTARPGGAAGGTSTFARYMSGSPVLKQNDPSMKVEFDNQSVSITRRTPWWGWGLRTVRIDNKFPYGWYVLDGEEALCSRATWDLLRERPQPREGDGLRFVTAPEDDFVRDGRDLIGDLEREAKRVASYVIEGFDDFGFVSTSHFEEGVRAVHDKIAELKERAWPA